MKSVYLLIDSTPLEPSYTLKIDSVPKSGFSTPKNQITYFNPMIGVRVDLFRKGILGREFLPCKFKFRSLQNCSRRCKYNL